MLSLLLNSWWHLLFVLSPFCFLVEPINCCLLLRIQYIFRSTRWSFNNPFKASTSFFTDIAIRRPDWRNLLVLIRRSSTLIEPWRHVCISVWANFRYLAERTVWWNPVFLSLRLWSISRAAHWWYSINLSCYPLVRRLIARRKVLVFFLAACRSCIRVTSSAWPKAILWWSWVRSRERLASIWIVTRVFAWITGALRPTKVHSSICTRSVTSSSTLNSFYPFNRLLEFDLKLRQPRFHLLLL